MKLTKAQQNDIDCIKYFYPKAENATEQEVKDFLANSERGIPIPKTNFGNSTNPLIEGKRWRGIHIHEMYEKGILDGSMPYFTILGGYDKTVSRKWWQIWKPKHWHEHNPVPRSVVDFMKKEMFKGKDADIIESCYQSILNNQ